MRNAVFWDVTTCGSCRNGRFGGTSRLHNKGDIVFLRSMLRLIVTANVVPSSLIFVTPMMKAFPLNVASYKSHTASYATRWHS
jgi:hypothetical protein